MLNLNGIIDASEKQRIEEYASIRLSREYNFRTPEALVLYEQKYMEKEQIKRLCEKEYGTQLYEPIGSYVPEEVIDKFYGSWSVPVSYMPIQGKILAVVVPELADKLKPVTIEGLEVNYLPTTLYYYIDRYTQVFGRCPLLLEMSAKLVFNTIMNEAIDLGASDITISTTGHASNVYYNVRKRKVYSKRIFDEEYVKSVIKLVSAKDPADINSVVPHYVDYDVNRDYRARIVINKKFKGYSLTIRLLPNMLFGKRLEDLNITAPVREWLRSNILDQYTGLRVIVGATCSGKNTTALSLLHELVERKDMKVVSVEMPVEQELAGVEQISTTTLDEYERCIHSLIHQNPDMVYITEIKDEVAKSILETCNTGKCVLATMHANSVAEAIPRLAELTGMSIDRVILSLHSIVYQELVRDDEKDELYPMCRYVRFSTADKRYLYNKPLGEIINYINGREDGNSWREYTGVSNQ